MGLHSASDRGGDTGEEEEETTGQSQRHTGEEPIKCLSAGQDFQCWQVTVTLIWLLGQCCYHLDFERLTKELVLNTVETDCAVTWFMRTLNVKVCSI